MSSLPANYVTLAQLKERFLKYKEREQNEKEEEERKKREEEERVQAEKERVEKEDEELRQQLKVKEEQAKLLKLKEEEAKLPKRDDVVVVRNKGRFDRGEIRPVAVRREYRPVIDRRDILPGVDRREIQPVVDRRDIPPGSFLECQGGEMEGPEEEKKPKKKDKRKKNKKNVRAENEEVSSEKECVAVFVVTESCKITKKTRDGLGRTRGERRDGVEFRAKSKNVEEIEPKLKGLLINGEVETGGDRLRRPNSRNAGVKDEIEPKDRDSDMNGETAEGRIRPRKPNPRNVGTREESEPKGKEFGRNGEIEKGNYWGRRPNHRNRVASEEIEPKVRDLEMNGETDRGSDKPIGVNSDDSVPKVEGLSKDGAIEIADRLRGPNKEGESESKIGNLVTTSETGGGTSRLWRLKGKNVGGKDETEPKVMDSLVKAETERRNGRLRMPSRSGYRKPWDNKKDQWIGMTWVKKGEASDGNVAGVQSSVHSASGESSFLV